MHFSFLGKKHGGSHMLCYETYYVKLTCGSEIMGLHGGSSFNLLLRSKLRSNLLYSILQQLVKAIKSKCYL